MLKKRRYMRKSAMKGVNRLLGSPAKYSGKGVNGFVVHRQVYDILQDAYYSTESRDRPQVDYYDETFNDMRLPIQSLIANGNLTCTSATDAEGYKIIGNGSAPWPDVTTGVLYLNNTTSNRAVVRFPRSKTFFTIANPNSYAVMFKMERYGWKKGYFPQQTDDLKSKLRALGQSYFVTSVDTNTASGVGADVKYPQNHNVPASGAFDGTLSPGASGAPWEGVTGTNNALMGSTIKKLSSRRWRRLLPGEVITYKITRPSITYPVIEDFWYNYRQFDFLLRFVFKSDLLYVGQTTVTPDQVVEVNPTLAMKVVQKYTATVTQVSSAGPIHVIARQDFKTRSVFPVASGGEKVTKPQIGGGTVFVEDKSAF